MFTRGGGGAGTEIDPLPVGYHQLLERAREVLEADDRVRGMWLSGSLARGSADAASDLDVVLAVGDDAHASFAATWQTWLAEITPTVLAQELPFAPGSFHSITPAFERFDCVVEPVAALGETFIRQRAVVFDKDGLDAVIPPPGPGPGPSADAVRGLITEFFRVSVPETVLVRDDWLLAREHLHHVSSLTYRLFTEANAPLPPMGVKQWSAKLTPAQREAMSALPTDADDITSFADAHVAVAELFVVNAEALGRRLGVDWPHELEAAAARHLSEVLGIDEPFPRSGPLVVDAT